MGDPSVVGRWENTPTIVPILERIDVIESDTGEFVDVTEVTPSDLVPEPIVYRIAPGDFITIEIMDIVIIGYPTQYEFSVNAHGYIDLPQGGRLKVAGFTATELRIEIENLVVERGLLAENPIVNVQVPGQRQATFSVFGAISQPARYGIPFPEYRILEALTDAGGVSAHIHAVFVIRQVPLTDTFTMGLGADEYDEKSSKPTIELPPPMDGDVLDIESLIEELTNPPEPGMLSLSVLDPPAAPRRGVAHAALDSDGQDALIDLPDSDDPTPPMHAAGPIGETREVRAADGGQWVFVDGRWAQVMRIGRDDMQELPEGADPLESGPTVEDLVVQRVIKVPVAPLLQGVARYNIIVRAGDVIHVPAPEQGIVYAMGPGIARPGTYNLPGSGKFTIQRLVAAAGGLSAIAIPERVDLTRVIGDQGQATIRLNVRAIFEGTQPDILLKPDDMVNFGTNFWATPLAIIRNGFRMTYGFGFLLDRNFGNDVFGPPPTNIVSQ